jgi:trk system potassium uptake protein TrkH
MRVGVIQRVISRLLWFTVFALAVPLAYAVIAREDTWWAWLIPTVLAALMSYAVGHLPAARSAPHDSLRRREGFLAVVLGWLTLVFFTAIAFHLTGEFPSFAGAFFESMSGYTTTGATVIGDIEALPDSVLLMRSWSHWIGGMGIIVLSVAILPELGVGGMQMFSAEASGFDSEKLAPRIAATARRLWFLYFAITAAEMVLLLFGGMGVFDSVNHAMATIATGGFSTKNASIAGFDSLYIEMVIVLFMFISGINFTLQYRAIIQAQPKRLWLSQEVRLYTLLIVGAIVFIAMDLYISNSYDSLADAFRYSSFQTVSIMTTTGFGTADFDAWPEFCRVLLVVLMVVGGCAGSTAGGAKVGRFFVVIRHAVHEIRRLIRPRLVQTLHMGEREIPRETTEAILGYFLLYFVALAVGALAMTALGLDLVSGATASVSAMNSIGPGLGTVGAVQNFSEVPDTGMYLLSFGMLLGRLEIYTVLVLFSSHFWRRG